MKKYLIVILLAGVIIMPNMNSLLGRFVALSARIAGYQQQLGLHFQF
ncbi:MAG: hypothetical protein WC659_03665 [Patescibacteria group bacterium]